MEEPQESEGFPVTAVVIGASAFLLIDAAVATFVLLKKKKKK